ncbi:unnamed protein product, partial [Polarella glacialis]
VDVHGRTAAHVAAVCRHRALAEFLGEGLPEAAQNDVFGHTARSLAQLQDESSREIACVSVAELPADGDKLFREFVATNRPVLVSGGAAHLGGMAWGDHRHLEALIGTEKLSAGPVPYAKSMGLPGGFEAPLSQLLASPAVHFGGGR